MFKLAFRNTLRNKRRTVITAISIFIAIFVILFSMSFLYSTIDKMKENEKLYSTGDIRIRTKKYSDYETLMPLQFYIRDFDSIKNAILQLDGVGKVEASTRVMASLYKNGELDTVSVIGADNSSVFFSLDNMTINNGKIAKDGRKEIMATPRFLSENNLSVGDFVTVVFKTAQGGTNASTFEIVASVSYSNAEYNSSMIIVPETTLCHILNMDNETLEAFIWLDEDADLEIVQDEVLSLLKGDGIEVKNWKEISNIYPILPLYDAMIGILVVLFFFIASTLVFNTLLMSVLERKREIGTMVSLGFSRFYVSALFVIEGFIIALFGSILGVSVSKIFISFFKRHGFDLTLFGASAVQGWNFPNIIYLDLSASRYFWVVLIELVVSVLASVLAVQRIRKLEVASTLREDE
mgnify:CR=1 FL=1